MMNATHHSSCRADASLAFRCTAALLSVAALAAGQSGIVRPPQNNPNSSTKQQHTATLRANDSLEGSRVAISSNQSLNDYEAYRRGDRLYVKIPAADVPRAEATRGRGFADVKVTRAADSTLISFRLQPGTTAHVEQHANKLDVVFNTPGAARDSSAGSNTGSRQVARANASSNTAKPPTVSQTKPSNSYSSSARNATDRTSTSSSNKNGSKTEPSESKSSNDRNAPQPVIASAVTPMPTTTASPRATPQKAAVNPTPSPVSQPTAASNLGSSETAGTSWQIRLKERVRYWILLAQLNPIPVVIGAVLLALLILLFIYQRRRLRITPRVRVRGSELATAEAPAIAAATESKTETVTDVAAKAEAAAATSFGRVEEQKTATAVETAPIGSHGVRQARIAAVAEQVKNVMAGGEYDQSVISSDDRETRQLVGAELLSAMVGRNLQRRERARAAFMNHGYFDDATRDLRIAEAPVERAAAARRLSFVRDREATPHLITALDDPAPEVRRTAVEALMDLRDPAAIGPLNALIQRETDRKVPRTLIKHAIEACATYTPDDGSPRAAPGFSASAPPAQLPSSPVEPEREVIEL